MKISIIGDLDRIIDITTKITSIIKFNTRKPLETIAIFDLSESTNMKLKIGHDETIKIIFLHNQICGQIAKRFKGVVIKDMGDGLLAVFDNPVNACLAAINIQVATNKFNIPSKAALTLGVVEEAKLNNNLDIYGTTVDMCARIEKCTFPNQVLMDRALYDVVRSQLAEYDDIKVGNAMQIILKGYGQCDLYEICSNKFELINSLNNPNYINVNDGLSFDEKLRFISSAKTDVVEIGLDTEELATDLDVYMDAIKKLLERGVGFKLIILIPRLDVYSNNKPKTEQQILEEMTNIKKISNYFTSQKLPGSFELLLSQEIPMYHMICVDRHSQDGALIISNYLNGIKKEAYPVLHLSKIANSEIFKTYHDSIDHMISVSIRQ